jgi:GNAT superfamily N-acetyltransferase
MNIEVRRLTPASLADFLRFFDADAFDDNPEWAGCYCVYYHASDADWSFGAPGSGADVRRARTQRHREVASDLIGRDEMRGFLAYVDGAVAGWCNANARESYQNAREYAAARDVTPRVGAVMCFVVAHKFRRTGVASALLDAVCQAFAAAGFEHLEAYPSLDPGGPTKDGGLYHGPMDLYVKAGFERVRDFDEFAVMRKRLAR